jgi:hypothetical protein
MSSILLRGEGGNAGELKRRVLVNIGRNIGRNISGNISRKILESLANPISFGFEVVFHLKKVQVVFRFENIEVLFHF